MKTVLIILLCTFWCPCFSQNPINEFAKSTAKYNEVHKEFFFNGQLRCSYTKIKGNIEGEYCEYFKNGKPFRICYFDHGHMNGTNFTYSKKGEIITEWKLAHDTLLFYEATLFYKNGKIKSKRNLLSNKDSLILCPFGKPRNTFNISYDFNEIFKKLKSTGQNIAYFKNGQIKYEGLLVNNLAEGIYKWYYKNGKLRYEGFYHQDKADGTLTSYYSTGKIKATRVYKNGKRIRA